MSSRDQRRAKKRREKRKAERNDKPTRVERTGPAVTLEINDDGVLEHRRALGGELVERFG